MKKKIVSCILCAAATISLVSGCGSNKETETDKKEAHAEKSVQSEDRNYEPVTIQLNLERSGLGKNVEYTFKQKPDHVVASGDQMADLFFDLGLEEQMAGYTKGSCWSLVSEYPARDSVPQIAEPGVNLSSVSKEELLATGCDFLIGWDSVFSDKNFSTEFCDENGIAMYFPYVCSDSATFEDLYKDYETLGKIFQVEETAEQKIQKMKDTQKWIPENILQYFETHNISTTDVTFIEKQMSPQQIYHYLRRMEKESGLSAEKVLTIWRDYLSMVKKLGKNLEDSIIYRPRALERRHVFIVSTALAINNTWEEILTDYQIDFYRIRKREDIKRVQKGQIVLLTVNLLTDLKREMKKLVRIRCQKVMLIFDESDTISNGSSKRTKAMLSVFRKCRYKVLATGTMTRNNVVEAAPQLELLYNNSIHYLAKNEWIFRFRNGQMEKYANPFFNQPFPAYKKGYELFSFSYLPKKITVFGLEKANQDIYNSSFLDELLEKTVITKNFEEVVGRKIYKIYQGTCSFNQTEKEVYLTAIKEFDKIRRKYFMACKNARKDAMFRILQQLMLLLKICADPSLAYEYNSNEPPTKVKKAIHLLQMWEKERVAIGVRKIEVAESYYHYLKQAFPKRPIFMITGKKNPCKQRQRIVEELRKTENGILLSTQQSLSESMNIDDVDKIILPELHYNHAAMEQYYFRFIRYTSQNFKQVVFLIYENSIEVNLLKMILAKEKINLFMKNQLIASGELYEKFGINPQIFSLLMTTGVDQEGKLQIQWGEQKIC